MAGGIVRQGDPVRELGKLAPAWPDDWRERVRQVLDAVPADHVIAYRDLAHVAGLAPTYCRPFPNLFRKLGPGYTARAVSANAARAAPRWNGAGLFDWPTAGPGQPGAGLSVP